MHEALREKAAKQALDGALLQMELHHGVGNGTGVLEDYRADGRGSPPFVELLFARTRGAQAVHGFRPRRLGVVKLGDDVATVANGLERWGVQEFERAGDG